MKFNYHKLTFFLSVIGFIASLAFYFSVLRNLHQTPETPKPDTAQLDTIMEDYRKMISKAERQRDSLIGKVRQLDSLLAVQRENIIPIQAKLHREFGREWENLTPSAQRAYTDSVIALLPVATSNLNPTE